MIIHDVTVHPERDRLARADQLAWHIASVAADPVAVSDEVADMIVNRIIDNAGVAVASLDRDAVVAARDQARAHPRIRGATLFGCGTAHTMHAEWAAWANGTAVRELDFHDTFLAAEYSHPGDNIPPILAVAQQTGRDGAALLRGLATGYEIQVDLARAICLHEHKIDHVAHLGPSVAAGLGTLLTLSPEIIFQAIGQALHVTTATRQSRKGEISSWKAYAPAHAGKLAIEAVDRAMRGQGSPAPIYEGEDGVIARMLGGSGAVYGVPLPQAGEPKRAILDTYTKEHSAEYQSQALIDLCFDLGRQISDWDAVEDVLIETSHHTHTVIGTGANDPQKLDPYASRETLDHSIMYIVAVALQDRRWHHVESYAAARAQRADTVALWRKIRTVEMPEWTVRYHATDPAIKAFGGRIVITLAGGARIEGTRAVANAHPLGATPWQRADYLRKFRMLTEHRLEPAESARFLDLVQRLPSLDAAELCGLNPKVDVETLMHGRSGLFEL